ncbi:homoserine kinase [Lutimonas saemankumensis]|uniref:homoserine kinase n=1 Tax=Lutimonas saemankumensis TaxID=483016 RepID=UPI001CD47BD3|nr:homoserine kinase [Lutimonas saemankumensis]MCA0931616.1 homoserine kinase [Lutimonas saemankumensis]
MKQIEIFSPATIANVSCGFDVLGCCLDSIGDKMVLRKTQEPGVRIGKIIGEQLPLEAEKNVASVAVIQMMKDLEVAPDFGIEIDIYKNIKPGSGVGSSAASAAGAVFAANELLGNPFSSHQLIPYAAEGERAACGAPIADNVAPALLGGFTLVKSDDPIKVLELPSIEGLYATIIHPQIEIKTSVSRDILPQTVKLKSAIKQWANVGALIHSLHTNDPHLFAESLNDYIVEPHRSKLIPEFDNVIKHAVKAGALGGGISGSGPSIFTFSKNKQVAHKVSLAIDEVYKKTKIPFQIYTSKINVEGVKIVKKQ